MLRAENLCVRRGAFELRASFEADEQGVTGVFGPSGSGKSVLLRTLAGLHPAVEGRLALGDETLDAPGSRVHTPPHRRGVGIVFQDARLFPHLSVRGNLAYGAKRAPRPAVWTLEETARRIGVDALLDRPVRALSGGEKSRVALARAILSAPRVLLLDEPFAALDGRARRGFVTLLLELNRDARMPMMVVTHQVEDAAELSDRLLAVKSGAVIASGPAAQVMNAPDFRPLLDVRDFGARLPAASVARGADTAARGVWVRADAVLIAIEEPRGLSAQNVWNGRIRGIEREAAGSFLVSVDAPPGPLQARITSSARDALSLEAGQEIWAVVKSHAI
ncbi:MAG: ATP-binding cassette domain-containing protein [Hyphomonadaceae bacterium]